MDLQYNSVTGLPNNPLDSIQNLDINPLFLFILVGILILFYVFFSVVSNQNNTSNNQGNNGTIFLEIRFICERKSTYPTLLITMMAPLTVPSIVCARLS